MKAEHVIALLLIPSLSVACAAFAIWSRWVRDVFFFLMVTLAVFAERLDVNFLSEAWYRGTTRGIQVSLLEIFAFALLVGCVLGRRGDEETERSRWYWPGSLALMLTYLFYCVASVVTSEPKLFGVFELSKIVGGIIVFLGSAAYVRTKREWTILLVALGLVVGFEGAWAVKQKFITHLERVAGTLDHANSLSMYFCMCTPPLVAAAYAGWTSWLRWIGGISAGLAAIGLLLTISRAGIPVFAAVCFATFILCASWKLTPRMIVVRTSMAVVLLAAIAALSSQIVSRYGEASLQEEYLDANVDGRGIYLRLAKNIASEHFFGIGLNNWSYHVSRDYGRRLGFKFEDYDYLVSIYGTDDIAKVFGDAYLAAPAHNLAALTLGELGIPGLIIFLALWGRWFALGFPFLFGRRDDPMRTMGVGLFFAVCGIFGQSITEWVFRQAPIMITFNILVGALAGVAYARRCRNKVQTTELAPLPAYTTAPTRVPEREFVPELV
jgi:hypothetical protein